MNKYKNWIEKLNIGLLEAKVFGQSMKPIIKSGSLLTFKKFKTYNKGDIVFCKVGSRYVDAHLITKYKSNSTFQRTYMIANNHGKENGWTSIIYGKVIKINGEKR